MAKYIKPKRHNFKIDGTTTGIGTKIYIDDTEIHGVRDIQYHVGMNEVSTVTLEVVPDEHCNLTDISDLEVTVDIDSLTTAIKCIRWEMRLNEEFRDAVVASVSSALVEHSIGAESVTEIAEAVVERVFEGCK